MIDLIKNFFKTDEVYNEDVAKYTKVDGMFAVGYYIFFLVVYYIMGKIYVEKEIYLGIWCNLGLGILPVIIVKLRNQKLSTLGLSIKKLKKSLVVGTILGLLMVFANNVIPSILSGCHLNQLSKLVYNGFYYFIIIAFVEEIGFRGYIQTRIYGLIKNKFIGIIIVSFMFSFMHIPFQMARADTTFFSFIGSNFVWLIILLFWHIFFNFLHKKYNNIAANTIFHGFMDWGNNLFEF